MAKFRGKDATVKIGTTTVSQITDWTLNLEGTEIDTSCIGTDWKSVVQGSRGWTAALNSLLDMGDTLGQKDLLDELISGTSTGLANVCFEVDEGTTADGYFRGTAVLTGASFNNPGNDDVVRCSMNMRGDGALTYIVATGT